MQRWQIVQHELIPEADAEAEKGVSYPGIGAYRRIYWFDMVQWGKGNERHYSNVFQLVVGIGKVQYSLFYLPYFNGSNVN